MRLFELARQLNVSSKRLLEEGRRREMGLNNHMMTITDEQVRVLTEAVTGDGDAEAGAAPAAPAKPKFATRKLAQAHHEVAAKKPEPVAAEPEKPKRRVIEPKKPEVPTGGPQYRPIVPPKPSELESLESLRRAIAQEEAKAKADEEERRKAEKAKAEAKKKAEAEAAAEAAAKAEEAAKAEGGEPEAADEAPVEAPVEPPIGRRPVEPETEEERRAREERAAKRAKEKAEEEEERARKGKRRGPSRSRRERQEADVEPAALDPNAAKKTPEVAPASRRPVPVAPSYSRRRRSRRRRVRGPVRVQKNQAQDENREYVIQLPMTLKDLSNELGIRANLIMGRLMQAGFMVSINQSLSSEMVEQIAEAMALLIEVKEASTAEDQLMATVADRTEARKEGDVLRPPIVTFMGHVDHGKTSLLDRIRDANVVAGESGGITQHIGAYQATAGGHRVTFLDTPGHEAFTAMRARGADVTDIVVLVVAADDGVMPQTVEAIDHAKAAGVPIVVACNKIDLPAANPDRVRTMLAERDLVPEEWGGDTVFTNVSAETGQGIDDLVEMLGLVAELQELKGSPEVPARGSAVEARVTPGQGIAVTLLVRDGTLRAGDIVLCGPAFGRVKAMHDDHGREVPEAPPSTPVEVLGLSEAPDAGDPFIVVESLQKAREVAEQRADDERKRELATPDHVTLESLFDTIEEGVTKELALVVKADVQGSVEALVDVIERLPQDKVKVNILRGSVGHVAESDVLLADASDAVIIGLHVGMNPKARQQAERCGVDIKLYDVIYHAEEEIRKALEGMLDPIEREAVIGHVEVRVVFRTSKYGNVAGCYVTDGVIRRNATVRIMRDQGVVHTCSIETLRRIKDDAREVREGFECGIKLAGYDDIKEGDIFEAFVIEKVAAKLEGQGASE